jgi:hypothetical protein
VALGHKNPDFLILHQSTRLGVRGEFADGLVSFSGGSMPVEMLPKNFTTPQTPPLSTTIVKGRNKNNFTFD